MSDKLIKKQSNNHIIINIAKQTLALYRMQDIVHSDKDGTQPAAQNQAYQLIKSFSISTAKNGIGNMEGTGCTPLGKHIIADKIGGECPINSVFVGRVPTGEIYDAALAKSNPDRDWILSRILWLQGCEQGINLGENESGCCDTYQRYIYIHGTPDTEAMGVPLSHGCVRMRNEDIVWLYDQVDIGTTVIISN